MNELVDIINKIFEFLDPPLDIGALVSHTKCAKMYSVNTGKEIILPRSENIDSNGEYNPIG